MAKKAPAKKAPAKRKPRVKKPAEPAIEQIELPDFVKEELNKIYEKRKALKSDSIESSSLWRRSILVAATAAGLAVSFLGGIYAAGGIEVGPGPVGDVLQQSYDADRITQVAVLRELSKQPFDGSTPEGKMQARDWFNAQRFRNRSDDFGVYSDRVAEAINTNSEDKLATELEAK